MQKAAVSFTEFARRFQTEEKCREFISQLRWPNGFACPKCEYDRFSYITTRHLYHCLRCNHQASVIANTIFHRSHTPLTKWFIAVFMISQSKRGTTAAKLAHEINVSQPTAWLMLNKLRKAKADKNTGYMLSKIVNFMNTCAGSSEL